MQERAVVKGNCSESATCYRLIEFSDVARHRLGV